MHPNANNHYYILSGAEKSSFQQMRFVLGWGPKPKLDNGLEARPKGYR